MEISVSTNQKENTLASAGAGWPVAERRAAERSEAERSGVPGQPVADSPATSRPRPEVVADARRRTFSLDYKLRILKEAEAVKGAGGIGVLLRREGLYSSHLTTWQHEREARMRQGSTPKTRGPKRKPDSSQDELQQLRREVQRLVQALQRAETVIDVKKTGFTAGLGAAAGPGRQDLIRDTAVALSAAAGVGAACLALAVPRATFYRNRPFVGPFLLSEWPPPPIVRLQPLPPSRTRLDQQARLIGFFRKEYSLNSFADCLKAVDTRPAIRPGHYAIRVTAVLMPIASRISCNLATATV